MLNKTITLLIGGTALSASQSVTAQNSATDAITKYRHLSKLARRGLRHYFMDGDAMYKCVLLLALTASLFAPPAMAQGKTSKSLPPPPPHLAGACANCHGTEGKGGGTIPALAGKDNEYLRLQLSLFKTGQRPGSVMNQLAKGYSDEELAFLAEYYSKKK